MRKFATPQTFVPGASPRMIKNEKTGLLEHERDKKGRYLWDMPDPIGTHKTTVVNKHGRVEAEVPVYRGFPASYARYMRSQFRRMRRKQSALQRAKDDALGFINNVLNPVGG